MNLTKLNIDPCCMTLCKDPFGQQRHNANNIEDKLLPSKNRGGVHEGPFVNQHNANKAL